LQLIGVILVFTTTYPQILKAKNRLKILLSRLICKSTITPS